MKILILITLFILISCGKSGGGPSAPTETTPATTELSCGIPATMVGFWYDYETPKYSFSIRSNCTFMFVDECSGVGTITKIPTTSDGFTLMALNFITSTGAKGCATAGMRLNAAYKLDTSRKNIDTMFLTFDAKTGYIYARDK